MGALVVLAITVAINFPCVSMWTLFGVAIPRLLTDPRRQRAFINVIMAAALVILAVLLLSR